MIPNSTEDKIQKDTIRFLISIGYNFINTEKINNYRENNKQVILKSILRDSLKRINSYSYKNKSYKFSDKVISQAVDDLDISLNEGLLIANEKISDLLRLGKSYREKLSDGVKKSFSLNYIDYKNIENNSFHFTEEFIVEKGKDDTRRPDLVLFINGIPLGIIELKRGSVEVEQAVSQMIRNQNSDEIPHLFKYSQILLAANNHSAKYGTVGTPAKFYSVWSIEEMSLTGYNNETILNKTILSLFSKDRFIELIYSFIIFDARVKKIARYQQYFAVKKILRKVSKIDNLGKRSGGVVWHTQGSGKSLTMVMLASQLKREIINSKIIIVTDRTDLDSQIHQTFRNNDIKAFRAKSGRHLLELLAKGETVITTLIHKFELIKNENKIFDNPNIFILVDESHRTQGGDMHKSMRRVFPSGCYLGFTGTPLMKKDKNTFDKFGGEIHRYTIGDAVKDKAVLPLLYEGRLVDQWIADEKGLDRKFEKISKHLNEEQTLDLKKKWTRFQRVASSERRLEMIMIDINEHFKMNLKNTGLKALLATSSKYEAIKYYNLFEEEGDLETAFVISSPDMREGYSEVDSDNKAFILAAWQKMMKTYGDEATYLDKLKDRFINSDEVDILIVVDKLLTGFDAPRASTLYIDKPLKDHNLLQAIARVNRLYDGKEFGFIIDYRGLLGNLDQALTDYSGLSGFEEEDLVGTVTDIKREIGRLKTYYSHLEELFKDVEDKSSQDSYEEYLSDSDKRKIFYEYLSNYAKSLKLSLSSDKIDDIFTDREIKNYKSKMKFYADLRKSIKIRYFERVDFGKYEKQMQKLLDTFISAEEVNQLTKLVNIFDESFDAEIARVVGDSAKADSILSASTAVITERKESNPAYYESLSLRIKDIIEKYKDKRLTEEEKLQHAKDIRDILRDETNLKNYPNSFDNKFKRAIYDNIHTDFESIFKENAQTLLTDFAFKINNIFKEISKKPDWQKSSDIKNRISGDLEDILWDLEDKYNIKIENIDNLIDKIRLLGINNYTK